MNNIKTKSKLKLSNSMMICFCSKTATVGLITAIVILNLSLTHDVANELVLLS